MSAYEKVRDAMAPETAKQTTRQLCYALSLLDGRDLDEAERIVQAILTDEICARLPEVDAAAEAWVTDDDTTDTLTAVIIRAALAAA